MRRSALSVLLVVSSCSAVLPDSQSNTLTNVTYALGGIMSGPYRVSADLESGIATEARPPPGVHGDGARVSAFDMPATTSRSLSSEEVLAIRKFASAVWKKGPVSTSKCPPGVMPPPDALGRFDIVDAGVTRSFVLPTPCMSPEADNLLRTLTCGANPKNYGCLKS